MKFLDKVIGDLLSKTADLSDYTMVIPGKRPMIFIKDRLKKKYQYSGFLPDFFTAEEIITEISRKIPIQNISIILFAYAKYIEYFPSESFDNFIKWFPTLLKDWDDMMKFSKNDEAVLSYMIDDERIKNWSNQKIGDESEVFKKNYDFWKNAGEFLPKLKESLLEKGFATSGMLHEEAEKNIQEYCNNIDKKFVFVGFNAFTPIEELLVKTLMKEKKAICYFQSDKYYVENDIQEAGQFIRKYLKWNEFSDRENFHWIENDFEKEKDISIYEVSGSISQTKLLPSIFKEIKDKNNDYLEDTALILLDENLLPASIDVLNDVQKINITMGFPLKNLDFSILIYHIFHIQKQLSKSSKTYYYKDIFNLLDFVPLTGKDIDIKENFIKKVKDNKIIYLSEKELSKHLSEISCFYILEMYSDAKSFLEVLLRFCSSVKRYVSDDIIFENISYFEQAFKIIANHITEYNFKIEIDALEVLINQIINTETIDFKGEPLEGLQVMGLLETRLLNFKNIILLSVNEGKLPLGNTQNTYLPFDVRKAFNMHTYLENDGIYAYHFYRLLQDSQNIYLLYNGVSSGLSTGEASRFITQIELESPHKGRIKRKIIENKSELVEETLMKVEKNNSVLEKLEKWKKTPLSASQLVSYLISPIDFYFRYLLGIKEVGEIEEELSRRDYGTLVHNVLEKLYKPKIGEILSVDDIESMKNKVEECMDDVIIGDEYADTKLEFYKKGMNFIYKRIAQDVIYKILNYDLDLVKNGNTLEILALEHKFENVELSINDGDSVAFKGFVDRIDKLNGRIRVIDYKTGTPKNLHLKFSKGKEKEPLDSETIYRGDDYKYILQLCIYLYYIKKQSEYKNVPVEAGIWSFAKVREGVLPCTIEDDNLDKAMEVIKDLIREILNPEIPFEEKEHEMYN